MTATIKVIETVNSVAKNGNKYKLVYVSITIGERVFVRRFAIFE